MDTQASSPLQWTLPAWASTSPAVTHRNGFARALAKRPVPDILRSYVYLTVQEMRQLRDIGARIMGQPLQGVGIELGAGCGLLSAVVAEVNTVRTLYAVELCEDMATQVMPRVLEHVGTARKVRPVVGSFDDIALPDSSVDFAVEVDSLHHSDDLTRTLTECARVLKPGGSLLCFDRCHPDSVTDEDVERMLSQVYDREFLAFNHYPLGLKLTRRENGEHEYRLREWLAAFHAAGFAVWDRVALRKQETWKTAAKGLMSLAPESVRRKFYRGDGPTLANAARYMAQRAGIGRDGVAPMETTVFVVRKR